MKSYQYPVLILLLLSAGISFSQQLTPFVISTSGGFYNNTSGMLSFTTGEMAAVETFSSPSFKLTQGFQQPSDFGTYITDFPTPDFSFGIYPNPSDGQFYLFTETETNQNIDVQVFNLLGIEIKRISFYQQSKLNVESMDLFGIPPGTYLISLSVKENDSFKPENHFTKKIQILNSSTLNPTAMKKMRLHIIGLFVCLLYVITPIAPLSSQAPQG